MKYKDYKCLRDSAHVPTCMGHQQETTTLILPLLMVSQTQLHPLKPRGIQEIALTQTLVQGIYNSSYAQILGFMKSVL